MSRGKLHRRPVPGTCWINGPDLVIGAVDYECRAHEVDAELRPGALRNEHGDFRRSDFYCPVGEPNPLTAEVARVAADRRPS